ncbi:MAG: endonuclease [Oscillospiraceae bacterium]|nr:endonuclease [Oscillospiraceae bacterium]
MLDKGESPLKKVLKWIAVVIGIVLLLAIGLIAFLSITEFKPEDREAAAYMTVAEAEPAEANKLFTIFSWNTGYAGLGEESDFFMDGGEMVDPPSDEAIAKNLAGISAFLSETPADAWLLQEIDINSARTNNEDQYSVYKDALNGSAAFAYNYKCPFVPIPVPPMGRIEGGIATYTPHLLSTDAERVSLPCPFEWPVRAANIKRCLLVTRLPLEGTDKQLVLVNLHLEAYDDGEGKKAQTDQLLQVLEEEYAKGNYVIAGGDFNQSFPGVLDVYPIMDSEKWTPGILDNSILPEGWSFAYDTAAATCRLLDAPYSDACQKYVIDGFIISPNVELIEVNTVDLDFTYSDHNPVKLVLRLGE